MKTNQEDLIMRVARVLYNSLLSQDYMTDYFVDETWVAMAAVD